MSAMTNPDEGAELILHKLMGLAPSLVKQADSVLSPVANTRAMLRERLLEQNDIISVQYSTDENMPESMCAIDGARVSEKLYGADLLVAVATNADGQFVRQQEQSISEVWADIHPHVPDLDKIVGTAMAALEISVAARVTHQIRLIDGSFMSPIVEFMKGLSSSSPTVRNSVADIIEQYATADNLKMILSHDPARPILALPKSETSKIYTQKFNKMYDLNIAVTDRVLATQLLDPGEILVPRPLGEWASIDNITAHSDGSRKVREAADHLNEAVSNFRQAAREGKALTCYFKPLGANSVLRFEYRSDEPHDTKTALLYAGMLGRETNTPHTLEPTAQWAVDRKAKTISVGTKALRAALVAQLDTTQAETWGRFIANNYRT